MLTEVERLRNDGRQALLAQDLETAEAAFVRALHTVDEDHRELLVDLYRDLAQVCRLSGRFRPAMDLQRASDMLHESVQPAADLSVPALRRMVDALRGDPERRSDLGAMLNLLASKERYESGGFPAAREHMEESVAIATELAPHTRETLTRQAFLATLRGVTDDLAGAVQLLDSIRDRLSAEFPRMASVLLRNIAQQRMLAGDLVGAEADSRAAVALAEEPSDVPERAAALSALGMIRSEQGDADAAIELYATALRLIENQPDGSVPSAVNLVRLGMEERTRGQPRCVGRLLDAGGAHPHRARAKQ